MPTYLHWGTARQTASESDARSGRRPIPDPPPCSPHFLCDVVCVFFPLVLLHGSGGAPSLSLVDVRLRALLSVSRSLALLTAALHLPRLHRAPDGSAVVSRQGRNGSPTQQRLVGGMGWDGIEWGNWQQAAPKIFLPHVGRAVPRTPYPMPREGTDYIILAEPPSGARSAGEGPRWWSRGGGKQGSGYSTA
ncbi:hypothetical protein B0T16DRAFT_245091 [Cercophora newfieldiana]|uniref:Uncharacterized protein n=1 Tax=Cercophora newfieldiana TaxID=92897 RepID=A0AA39XSN3_9PEZI|nr:hypothetical protein B0T16DRAFT_245091 [Cercophora newfieldiana]